MERFAGTFLCATNLLDSASLRRFNFKIGLDWLKHTQQMAVVDHVRYALAETSLNPP
jgi:hypothetical protein